jgi:DDE superfamily endonuclease
MSLHLQEIAQAVAPGAHAIVLLDRAGWHQSRRLAVPDNITLLPLPPKSPELNPMENFAIHARELALEPGLHVLRRYPRSVLRSVEQARRPALDHHVYRTARLGTRVLINESWYWSACDIHRLFTALTRVKSAYETAPATMTARSA